MAANNIINLQFFWNIGFICLLYHWHSDMTTFTKAFLIWYNTRRNFIYRKYVKRYFCVIAMYKNRTFEVRSYIVMRWLWETFHNQLVTCLKKITVHQTTCKESRGILTKAFVVSYTVQSASFTSRDPNVMLVRAYTNMFYIFFKPLDQSVPNFALIVITLYNNYRDNLTKLSAYCTWIFRWAVHAQMGFLCLLQSVHRTIQSLIYIMCYLAKRILLLS